MVPGTIYFQTLIMKYITNKTSTLILIVLMTFITESILAQKESLRHQIDLVCKSAKGKVGFAVLGLEDKDTMTYNGKVRFPMQSVYKFPLAMAILDQVDKGKFTLNQKIHITKKDLLPNIISPLKDLYPNGNVDIPLSELLSYTVSKSDGNGCDILFRMAGRTGKVDNYIHRLGVKEISIVATEEQMHKEWNVQYQNACEPIAMTHLMEMLFQRKVLSGSSSAFLLKIMTETTTGPNRIKGLLPKGTIVAHKTGTSDTNKLGVTAATNDVGIVTLPNGKHFAIAVFVGDSKDNQDVREKVIAKITKAVWDYYTL